MRRRLALPVAALLATALLATAGCTASAKRTDSALLATSASSSVQQHHHGQAASQPPAAAPRGGVVELRVDRPRPSDVEFQWKPGSLLLSPGQTVTLKVANNDDMQHNLLFKAAKVNRNLPVGKVTAVRFTAPGAGTYAFWCKYHLQMMKGTVTVR
jgi:plastocyanin